MCWPRLLCLLACTACGRINYDQLAVDSTTPDASSPQTVDADTVGQPDALVGCPADYVDMDGSCYRYESTPKN